MRTRMNKKDNRIGVVAVDNAINWIRLSLAASLLAIACSWTLATALPVGAYADESAGPSETTEAQQPEGTADSTDIGTATVSAIDDCTYDGKEQKPAPTVTVGQEDLTEGTDYSLSYSDNVNAGTASVTITGINKYTGSITKEFSIGRRNLEEASVKQDGATYKYCGLKYSFSSLTITYNGKTLEDGTDYTRNTTTSYINAGSYSYTVDGKGNFTGKTTVHYTISPADIGTVSVQSISSYTYTGHENCPKPTIYTGTEYKGKKKALKKDIDYALSYEDNVNAGTAKVIITGRGNYTGSMEKTFYIEPVSLLLKGKVNNIPNMTYSGSEQKPIPTVTANSRYLTLGDDFSVRYTNNIDAGCATVWVKGTGNYIGEIAKSFNIDRCDISTATISNIEDKVADGNPVTQPAQLTANGATLVEGKDYTTAYSGNVTPGTATVTFSGEGNYTGSNSAQFNITGRLTDAVIEDIPDQRFELDSENDEVSPSLTITLFGEELTGCRVDSKEELDSVLSGDLYMGGAEWDYYYYLTENDWPGKATAHIVGTGSITGEAEKQFNIYADLDSNWVRIFSSTENYYDEHGIGKSRYYVANRTYTGKPVCPKTKAEMFGIDYTCTVGGVDDNGEEYEEYCELSKRMKEGRDYTVFYKNNVNPGKATVIVTGTGYCRGTLSKTFKILFPMSKAKIAGISKQTYKGKAVKPQPAVTCLGKKLTLGKDYTLSYKNNRHGGEATVYIKGKGLYKGTKKVTFKVNCSMKYAKTKHIPTQYLYSKRAKPKPVVKVGGTKLKRNRDYTLSYKKNNRAGKATVYIKGKGYYKGTKKVTFKIAKRGKGKTISAGEYRKIHTGMPYRQVKYLIGGGGKKTYTHTQKEYEWDDAIDDYYTYDVTYSTYDWKGKKSGSGASITFKDGRVISKSKWSL